MFTQAFDSYVVQGNRITCEVDGFTCHATLEHDADTTCEAGDPGYEEWRKDEWHYFGLLVTIHRDGAQLTGDYSHATWGIDGNFPGGNNNHFRTIANENLPGAVAEAKALIAKWALELPA